MKCQECGDKATYELTYLVHSSEYPEGFVKLNMCVKHALELESKFKNTPAMNNLIIKRL